MNNDKKKEKNEKRKKMCIVFDFDQTLTKEHLFYFLRDRDYDFNYKYLNDTLNYESKELIIDHIWGGPKRIKLLKEMCNNLINAKIDLFISSYGYLDEIEKALNIVNMDCYFKDIHSCKTSIKYKTKFKYLLSEIFTKYKNIIYLDDDDGENLKIKKFSKKNGIKIEENDKFDYIKFSSNNYKFIKIDKGLTKENISYLLNSIQNNV